ncbi:hypothetical protein D1AOALGA4SA_4009 [Olavius algarvensis Delta 1 endosymbiont]|nr:hypothetical protein D1AOALGA4SA_4009 [Olavius algarvensis Delta 1 endosymbiont]
MSQKIWSFGPRQRQSVMLYVQRYLWFQVSGVSKKPILGSEPCLG